MKAKMFKGLSVENCWLPLTATVLEGHNIAMKLSNNDDAKYCNMMLGLIDVIKVPYNTVLNADILYRFLHVFIYVMEFVYGDPYSKEHKTFNLHVTVRDYFENIMKHWNDDITKAIEQVDRKNNK